MIDAHAHRVPPDLRDRLAADGERLGVRLRPDGRVEFASGEVSRPIVPGLFAPQPPADWLVTTEPRPPDVDAARTKVARLDSVRAVLRQAQTQHTAWTGLRGQMQTLRQGGVQQFYAPTDMVRWRRAEALPPARC